MITDLAERSEAAGNGRADPLAVALYRAAILEADRILSHDADRLSLADVLELDRTLQAIAAELAS